MTPRLGNLSSGRWQFRDRKTFFPGRVLAYRLFGFEQFPLTSPQLQP